MPSPISGDNLSTDSCQKSPMWIRQLSWDQTMKRHPHLHLTFRVFFVEQNINVPFETNGDFLAWKRKRLDPCAWWTSGLSLKRGLAQSSCHSKVHMKNWRMVNHKGHYTYMSHSVSTHVECVPSTQARRFFFQIPTKTCQERVNRWTTFLPFTMFQPNLPGYTAIPSLLDVPCHASPIFCRTGAPRLMPHLWWWVL